MRLADLLQNPARIVRWISSGGLVLALALAAPSGNAADDATALLLRADQIRTSNQSEFSNLLDQVARSGTLSETQENHLHYLQGWKLAYDGHYEAAQVRLREVADRNVTPTLTLRAQATLVNVLAVAGHYDLAFQHLEKMLTLLPQITDRVALEQARGVAAYLYNQVGEYDLGSRYARELMSSDPLGRAGCSGGQLYVEAEYRAVRHRTVLSEAQGVIDHCMRLNEVAYANFVRSYVARIHLEQRRFDEAIRLLQGHYEAVLETRYPRLISEFDALLALAYRETGNTEMVELYATRAVEHAVPGQHTDPLVQAYRLLYVLAKERNQALAALSFHEKYAAADKGFLDDVSARQLAYERVKHETAASRVQIETLNSENQILQLQRENNRLYIALLIVVAGFIAFFAYRVKRSQLHFMKLSQQDGLTSISNRPHFLQLAEASLDGNRKIQQEVCVILCDLDHFKAINDRFGHASGDTVLREVVARFRTLLRAGDILGRVGGEEFGILLPGCSVEAARDRCEQLRSALAALEIKLEHTVIQTTASFGIETTASCGYDLRALLANADAALYQAKHTGRDQVMVYDPSMANTFIAMQSTGRFRSDQSRFDNDLAPQTR